MCDRPPPQHIAEILIQQRRNIVTKEEANRHHEQKARIDGARARGHVG
jgi:hypothetical protein